MSNLFKKSFIFILTVFFISCSGGGGGSASNVIQELERSKAFVEYLNDNGENVVLAKHFTKVEGFIVVKDKTTGEYIAYDVSGFDRNNPPAYSTFVSGLIEGDNLVSDLAKDSRIVTTTSYEDIFIRSYDIDSYDELPFYYDGNGGERIEWDGYIYDIPYNGYGEVEIYEEQLIEKEITVTTYSGGGYVFQKGNQAVKDLELLGAIVGKHAATVRGEQLAENYGLSETRGIEIARLLNDWEALSKNRSMTEKDFDAFGKKLVGFGLKEGQKAYQSFTEGNGKLLDELMQKAAKTNGTSPENMQEIFFKFFN